MSFHPSSQFLLLVRCLSLLLHVCVWGGVGQSVGTFSAEPYVAILLARKQVLRNLRNKLGD